MAANLFFVFVRLIPSTEPRYHIVPREAVRAFATRYHRDWIGKPRRDGLPRQNNAMRKFADPENEHLDRWDLLGLDAPAG